MGWIWVVLVFALVPILRFRWTDDKSAPKALSSAIAEALGPELATLLRATRALSARLADLETSIKVHGAQEIQRKKDGLVRAVRFEVGDANLYQEIRDAEAASLSWSELGHRLRGQTSLRLGTSLELPSGGFSIPWTIELGAREDRIAELQAALAACRDAAAVVQRVDAALSSARR